MKKYLLVVLMAVFMPRVMTAATVWSGEQVIDWGNGGFLQLDASKFAGLKAGDQLVFGIVYTGNTDWPQIQLNKGDWSGTLTGAANTAVAAGMTEVRYTLLSTMTAELQASGLIVSGIGFTLTSISTVDGDGGDYSHAVWIGETTIGNWSGYQQLAASCFGSVKEGQLMRIKFKNTGAGAYLSLRNPVDGWPDLTDATATYIAGTKQDYTVTAAMLAELKANGMVVSGVNFTLTTVEIWNADELMPLTMSVPVTSGWVFNDGAPSFTVQLSNPHSKAIAANVVVDIATDTMEPVARQTASLTMEAGGAQSVDVQVAAVSQPGIYHATITVNDDLARAFSFAVKPTQIVSAPDMQSDFASYWQAAKDQLAQTPIAATLTEIPSKSGSKRKVYLVEMQSVADGLSGEPAIIRGYYAEPVDGKKHPVLMHFQGYDSEYRPGGDSATPWCLDATYDNDESAQYAEFVLSNRGQSVNNRPASGRADGIQRDFTNTYGDWFAYQFGQKDSYYYRGAYMDCLRALDFMASRSTSDMQNLFAEGQSQGGAFTVAAAALSDYKFKAIAPAITFMGDFPDYFQIVSWPAYVAYNNQGSMSNEEMLAFMSYYDTKNLATAITCPYITSVGLQDNVCPPHTNLAPYNNLQTPEADKQVVFNAELQHATNSQWNSTYMDFFKRYMGTTTAIRDVRSAAAGSTPADVHVYTLSGQRTASPAKGVYIIKGKKAVVR
ncbi:MAG: acetylxylan esterase [Prevotella sp.]|nr:acetylxylan esterase [Prevotella sp.]